MTSYIWRAKMIVKYTLEVRTNTSNPEPGLTAPECITNGGQFADTEGNIIGYSDGTKPLGVTCVEITEAELEAHKSKVNNTHECSIRSSNQYSYTEAVGDDANGFMVAKTYPGDVIAHYYTNGDSSCEFYSDRGAGRKKYWSQNIPADKYSQTDSDSQILSFYSEMTGVTKEWYYEFITFEEMMAFVNSHNPIALNPTLEAKMKNNPLWVRPTSAKTSSCMYIASLEVTAAGDKTTAIYVTAQPKDIVLAS